MRQRNPYHLVERSPWPIVGGRGAWVLTTGGVMYMHRKEWGGEMVWRGAVIIIYVMIMWWRDVIREGTYEGHHTKKVQKGLRYGMILFIVSECMFFFAFFWAYYASSLGPGIEIGGEWPPTGIKVFNPWEIPRRNTIIRRLSGAAVTWAHHAIIGGKRRESKRGREITIGLGMIFTVMQGMEYKEAGFTIADSVYGSTFYMATGFHGIHVRIGTMILIVSYMRQRRYEMTQEHHVGFEAAAWYWHFVDVVWLMLFVSVYWWGGA